MLKLGLIARFRPPHRVHAALLRALAARGRVSIGIGSSNRYDARNPFTLEETRAMLEALLAPEVGRYTLLAVPDLGNGPRWRAMVRELMGPLDLFVTANDYVRALLHDVYRVAHPRDLVPRAEHAPIDGTRVRRAMARGEPWEALVPLPVATYLRRNALDLRFRREFGLATLAEELEGLVAPSRSAGAAPASH